MSRIARLLYLLHTNQGGQIAILTAGAITAILGIAALAIDLGFFAENRRDSRNAADAMALAGVQELATRGLTAPQRESNATDEAEAWAGLNDVELTEVVSITYDETCNGGSVADIITVRLQKTQTTFLAGVLGIGSGTIKACATARTGLARGGYGLLPIGILKEDPAIPGSDICFYQDGTGAVDDNFYYDPSDGADLTYAPAGEDERCVIKISNPNNDDTWAPGQTGPFRLDDPSASIDPDNYDADCDDEDTAGSDTYGENIIDGSECSYSVGDFLRPLPGAQIGKTCVGGFNTRLAGHGESDGAHTDHNLTDVFQDPIMVDGKPIYTTVDVTSPHFGLLPVVTPPSGGASVDSEIVTFVTVYVVGCEKESGAGPNSKFVVTIIPVNSQFLSPGQEIVEPGDSDFSEDWPAYTIKLIE